MTKYTRKLTPIVGDECRRRRACHDRTQTVMKKGDELAVLCPGTRVWVIVQSDGQTSIYSSEESSSLPILSTVDNVVTTGPGDYRTHNEVIATGLTPVIQYIPPPSTTQQATSSLPAATSSLTAATSPLPATTSPRLATTSPRLATTSPRPVSSPPPSITSQYAGVTKRTNPALDRGRSFRRIFDLQYSDEEGLERGTKLRKFGNESIHSSSRRNSRIKAELNSRSYMRDIPKFRSSHEITSSGSRAYL
ncbi:hypothetical protein SBOR_8813 [Sclerotinia borealis F-4128]|uniref:MADS-box domain-containing protein n=1 Tax=Sclerotinia borealis (strain F-4128) TaxID=1432307 RepID=W9C544_SCLBF|nr:hypothetical protein SBOR_8813 [Sclerotinia borealis F-4128]